MDISKKNQHDSQTNKTEISIKNSINQYFANFNIDKNYDLVSHAGFSYPIIKIIFFLSLSFGVNYILTSYIDSKENKNIWYIGLAILAVFGIISYLFSSAVYFIIANIFCIFNSEFLRYFALKNTFSLKLLFYFGGFDWSINNLTGLDERSKILGLARDWLNLAQKISLLLLLRTIIIDCLNYSIYKKHHEKRLKDLLEHKEIFISFSNFMDGDISDVREWANHLFKKFKDSEGITLQSFQKFFSSDISEKAMKIYDIDNNPLINEREFITCTEFWIKKFIDLERSIQGSQESVYSVNILMCSALGIIIFQMTKSSMTTDSNSVSKYSAWFGILYAPVSSVVIALATEIIFNVHVLYILRPYDIGDKIEVDKELIECKTISFLSSEYEKSNMKMKILNKAIIDKDIVNYRLSEFNEVDFNRTLNYKNPEKIEKLKFILNDKAENNKNVFGGKIRFLNYKVKNDQLNLTIKVPFVIREHDSMWYHDNVGEFSYFLFQEIQKLNLQA